MFMYISTYVYSIYLRFQITQLLRNQMILSNSYTYFRCSFSKRLGL